MPGASGPSLGFEGNTRHTDNGVKPHLKHNAVGLRVRGVGKHAAVDHNARGNQVRERATTRGRVAAPIPGQKQRQHQSYNNGQRTGCLQGTLAAHRSKQSSPRWGREVLARAPDAQLERLELVGRVAEWGGRVHLHMQRKRAWARSHTVSEQAPGPQSDKSRRQAKCTPHLHVRLLGEHRRHPGQGMQGAPKPKLGVRIGVSGADQAVAVLTQAVHVGTRRDKGRQVCNVHIGRARLTAADVARLGSQAPLACHRQRTANKPASTILRAPTCAC